MTILLHARRTVSLAACGLSFVAFVHCGGATTSVAAGSDGGPPGTTNPDASTPGTNPDAGTPIPIPRCDGGGSPSEPGSRPTAVACNATPSYLPDAGDASCTTSADCADAGALGYFKACLGGKCAIDACLTDSDCPSGQACGCSTQFGGNAIHTNACIPAECRVNTDCGSGGICSPAQIGYCGSLSGYYCHSTADTCTTAADCCDRSTPACEYEPTLGHFACQANSVCGG
jgi:hypothetical protein